MNLLATVKSWFGPSVLPAEVPESDLQHTDPRRGPGGSLAASLTAGLYNADLGDHFAYVNSLSARAALSSDVRRKIRERFRFERTQNSFLAGMVQSAANYAIGTGPRLQMMTDDRDNNREIETAFAWWARKIKLAEKLRTCVMSKIEGESFGVMTANPWVRQQTGISLDFIPLEADQVEHQPWTAGPNDDGGGGIRYDTWDNPTFYRSSRLIPRTTSRSLPAFTRNRTGSNASSCATSSASTVRANGAACANGCPLCRCSLCTAG